MKRGALCLTVCLVLRAPLLHADDTLAQAKTFFDAGAGAFEAGNYTAASQAFQQAYDLVQKPAILFSIAQAERKQYYVDRAPAHIAKAVELYRKYLSQVSQGGRRDDAVQALADCEAVLRSIGPAPVASAEPAKRETRISVYSTTRGGAILVDGKPAGTVPSSPEVAPGRHHVSVSLDGYAPFDRDVEVAAGTLAAVDAALVAKPAQLMVVAPDGARVTVDGRPVGELPMAAPLDLPAGHHFVTVALSGHEPEATEVEVGRGEYKLVRTGLRKTTQRRASYVVLGTAGVGLIAGGTLAVIAVAKQTEARNVQSAATQHNITLSDRATYDDARSARDHFRTAAGITLGASAGLALTGALLYAFDDPPVRTAPAIHEEKPSTPAPIVPTEIGVAPILVPGFLGGSLGGRF